MCMRYHSVVARGARNVCRAIGVERGVTSRKGGKYRVPIARMYR